MGTSHSVSTDSRVWIGGEHFITFRGGATFLFESQTLVQVTATVSAAIITALSIHAVSSGLSNVTLLLLNGPIVAQSVQIYAPWIAPTIAVGGTGMLIYYRGEQIVHIAKAQIEYGRSMPLLLNGQPTGLARSKQLATKAFYMVLLPWLVSTVTTVLLAVSKIAHSSSVHVKVWYINRFLRLHLLAYLSSILLLSILLNQLAYLQAWRMLWQKLALALRRWGVAQAHTEDSSIVLVALLMVAAASLAVYSM